MRTLLWMLPLVLASPAKAEYRGSGLLQWSFDDLQVRAPSGSRHSTAFNQSYRYAVDGPLGTPMIGEGRAGVTMTQGKSLSQSVVGQDAEQKVLGYSFNASLLPPGLRRYVTLAPSFGRTLTSQVWGAPAVKRDLIEDSRGVALGLAVPKLPSFSLTRSRTSRADASAAPVVNQVTELGTEQAAYVKGPIRTEYRHDTTVTSDRLNPAADARTGLTAANFEVNMPDRPAGTVKSIFWRESYQAQRTDYRLAIVRQESYVSNLYLTTRHAATRFLDSYLGYSGGHSRSMGQAKDAVDNSLTLFASGRLARGRVDNQLGYRRADGRSRRDSVSESSVAEWSTASGRYSFRLDGGGGWSWAPEAGAALDDSLRHRLTWNPHASYSHYAEIGLNGSTPLDQHPGGSRQHLAGTGASLHVPYTDLSSNYTVSRSRSLSLGLVTVNQSLTAGAQSSPIEGLTMGLTYSLNWNRASTGASSRNSMLNLKAGCAASERLQITGELSATGRMMNAALGADYTIGKTRASLRYERVELYTVNSYSRLNVTLARQL